MKRNGRIPTDEVRRYLRLCTVIILVAGIDQITKWAAVNALRPGDSVPIITGVFHFTMVHNTGAVFGIFRGFTVPLILSSLVFLIVLFYFYPKIEKEHSNFYLQAGLVAGGASANLLDRLRYGYVIDFIDFRIWPVFNFADAAITVGAVLFVLKVWRSR